jgi:L-aminoadipate-semialdehyde dehydrogenase
MIIHSASLVHFLYPYELLKDANVRGTVELLRLAVTHRLKVRPYARAASRSWTRKPDL